MTKTLERPQSKTFVAGQAQKPKVLIGLPTMSSVHVLLMVTIMSWLTDAFQMGDMSVGVYPTMSVQPVDNARNQIVDEFLASDYTHLLFIDADTIPPPDALRKLLAHDLPIVSAITPIVELDENSNMFYRVWNCVGLDDKHVKKNEGLKEIKGAGSSCILIKREVFEKMEKPYYRFLYTQSLGGQDKIVSEDIHFVVKAINAGIKPYTDTDIICRHYKSTMW